MSEDQARYSLRQLKMRYALLRWVEIIFSSAAISFLAFALAGFLTDSSFRIVLSALVAAAIIALMVFHYKLHRLSNHFFTSFLNKTYPELAESADLLLIDESELPQLQQLQKKKTLENFNLLFPQIKLPNRVLQSVGVFVVCIMLSVALSSLNFTNPSNHSPSVSKEIRPDKSAAAIFIQSLTIVVSPPSYTAIKSFEVTDFNLIVPEGSTVKWIARFSEQPKDVKIFFSGRDSTSLSFNSNNEYSTQQMISESGFYQIQWRDKRKTYRSDFYKLEVVRDQDPKISVKNLNQFTRLKYTDALSVELKSDLSDDYGLTDAQIIATVSKGSGEGVKFREEKLRFSSPQKISGKRLNATRLLDLKKLNLEPGDELYFYVEAFDNKVPSPNRSRTETFFIALQDTATEISSVDSGLGVDLLPEYFRSQRQIIIDTEKLLRNKKGMPQLQFKSTSNELGYDQKVLRLRYGQFLGEEDEVGIGQHTDAQDEEEQDVTKQYGHQHDTKNEHNLVEQKNQKHDHAEENSEEEKEDPLKAFVHQHDNTEEATFFIQSLKSKLKAAITQMWDAELYLRLYQPEKSLPYQYRALNLLKEISSDSRIFVHRSGFDPPPIKEEKRLTADLSEIKTNANLLKVEAAKKFPAIEEALILLDKMIGENMKSVSVDDQKIFTKAGQELSSLAIEQPVIFLKGLTILKSLSEDQSPEASALRELRTILLKALPQKTSSPNQHQMANHTLNQKFLQNLDQIKHD